MSVKHGDDQSEENQENKSGFYQKARLSIEFFFS